MSDAELPKLVRDLVYAQRYRLLDDGVGRAAKRAFDAGVVDRFVEGIIGGRVAKHRIARAFAGPFLLPNLRVGEIVLGVDERDEPVRCPLQALNAHALALGGSGSGKTTKSLFLALQIAALVLGMWYFDLRKREGRALRSYLARLGVDLIVVRARDLRMNPLQVPWGVEPMDWAPRVADMLVMVLRLPPRAAKLIHATIIKLYDHFGILRGGHHHPTFFHLREAIAHDAGANAPARQAIVDSLDPVLLSIGNTLRYHIGWTTRDLARMHLVFELGGISEADRDLILNTLLLSEFSSRLARGVSNCRMDLWICADEAGRLVSTLNPTGGISDLIGLVRGTGIGLDLAVQSADIAPAILSNTATKFVGRCGSAADYDTIAGAIGLNASQRNWLRTNLVPGTFIGQVGEGHWRHPFVFRVPPMRLSPETDVNRESQELGDLHQLPVKPARDRG